MIRATSTTLTTIHMRVLPDWVHNENIGILKKYHFLERDTIVLKKNAARDCVSTI